MRLKLLVRTKLVVLALLGAAILAGPPAAGAVVVGIGDQKGDFFADKRFGALGIRHARLIVPWDAVKYQWQIERVDRWLGAAQRARVVPLIVFGKSITEQYHTMLPTVEDFTEIFDAFHARYPWVREYATWNEPNLCTQPTCLNPERVAEYYNVLVRRCPGCRVLGGSVLGVSGMGRWIKRFLAVADPDPRYWGLHNYLDVNSFNRQTTRSLLKVVKGEVWLTETAGLVGWDPGRPIAFRPSVSHAILATRWLFDWMLPVSPRIKRVYLYEWNAVPGSPWDSALISRTGRSRPTLSIVRRVIKKGIRRPGRGEKRARQRWVRSHLGK
ncbi:MAG: hypothetical protein QOI98_2693 [Solirubrobacteraceae bacterium]|jgi:hypothetical protein|nr:hypothetical protein [Solirubrobacteraceae bacterium]